MVFNMSRGLPPGAPASAAPLPSAPAPAAGAAGAAPSADADAKTTTTTRRTAEPVSVAEGAAPSAPASTAPGSAQPVDPFVAFMQKELTTQHRFLQAQTAMAQQTQPKSSIPWGGLIFLAIAVLNFWRR
jgi:hypothetical protein